MDIESRANLVPITSSENRSLCKLSTYNPCLQLEIDWDDIAKKREEYIASQQSLTYKEPDNIVIKIAVPLDARIMNIPVKWGFD